MTLVLVVALVEVPAPLLLDAAVAPPDLSSPPEPSLLVTVGAGDREREDGDEGEEARRQGRSHEKSRDV